MCATCGCGAGDAHAHAHSDGHTHAHDHQHEAKAPSGNTVLQVEQAILAQNDHIAAHNLSLLNRHHTRGFNLVSSPGAGKTTLLENTLTALRARNVACAVIEGD